MQILVYYPSANFHYCSSGNTNHEVASTNLPSESLHKLEKNNDTDEMRNSLKVNSNINRVGFFSFYIYVASV